MAKRGPQTPAKSSANLAFINLPDLIDHPEKYQGQVPASIFQAFGGLSKIKEIANQYLELAKLHDPEARLKGVLPFIETNRTHCTESFSTLVRFVDFYCAQHPINYDHMHQHIAKQQARADELSSSNKEDDKPKLAAYKQAITENMAISMQQILLGCEKVNLWHTLLTYVFTDQQLPGSAGQTIRKALIDELCMTTGHLVSRFLNSQLEVKDYYLIYQILDEKYRWFEQFIEAYQQDLQCYPTQSATIENILLTFQNAIVFRTGFGDKASCQALKSKALAFCDGLKIDNARSQSLNKALQNLDALESEVSQLAWLPIFKALDQHLTTPAHRVMTVEALQQQAGELKVAMAKAPSDEESPSREHIQNWILTLLKLIAKPVPPSEATMLFGLAMQVIKVIKNDPYFNTRYIGPCIQSTLKKIADELLQVMKDIPTTLDLPVVVTIPTLTEVVATELDTVTELTTELSQLALNKASDEDIAREQMIKEETQAHEVALSHSRLESQQQHRTQSRAQKKRLAKERKALKNKLSTQREEALSLLQAEHKNELERKEEHQQAQLKQIRREAKGKLNKEKEALQKAHEAEMAKTDKEHQVKVDQQKERLAKEQQQQLAALQARLVKERKAKKATQHAELEALAKANLVEVAKASADLTISHQQALNEIISAHLDKRAEMMEKVRRFKRATDGHVPLNTFALPVDVARDLLALDNAGIEAYLRGGWVRDRLLGLPGNPRADIDVIVRCSPEEFRQLFPGSYVQNLLEPRQFTHGNIDFWCSEWDDLAKEPCDFTINSFICDLNGRTFDLRGYASHLSAAFLHVIGDDAKKAFAADPIKMLRMLRLAPQVGKGIEAKDYSTIIDCASIMTHVKMGIYLKNIQQLFINPYALFHLDHLIQNDLLRHILPGIINPPMMLKQFWDYKLCQFKQNPEFHNHSHLLGLFFLQPLVAAGVCSNNHAKIQDCIDVFLNAYQGEKHDDVEKIRKATLQLLTDHELPDKKMIFGLITEYDCFARAILEEQHRQAVLALAAEQRNQAMSKATQTQSVAASATYLASYQHSQQKQRDQQAKLAPAPQSKSVTLNGKQ